MSQPTRLPGRLVEKILSAMVLFDKEHRSSPEWLNWEENKAHKYAILHNDKVYPVKKIVSLATGVPVSEFSGGREANGYVTGLGFQVVSLRAFSWSIESGSVAHKILDKSAFLHRGTGIPKEIRLFFLDRDLSSGERHPVSLVFQGHAFAAHIDMEGQDSARTRLFWNADFTSLLKETFPHHYQQYSTNQTPDTQVILRLKRLSGYDRYEVSFAGEIPTDAVEQDIQSEELEEKGPQKEGGVREYYGKRYERSAVNRQQAIKIHGLSCNACGFNFEKVYGARGADYIEVHHVKPIHTYEQEQHVDPKTDLITLCSNCHRMTHRDRNNVLSMDALKELIGK